MESEEPKRVKKIPDIPLELFIIVANVAHGVTNSILRAEFASLSPKKCKVVYRNSLSKGTLRFSKRLSKRFRWD